MSVSRRAFRGLDDLPRVVPLIRAMPDSCRHVIDYPWRLTSPAIAEGRDAVYWEDEAGQVVGFAAWQLYWATLDFYILPGPEAQAVERELFAWAGERFAERDVERGRPLPYSAEYRDDDEARRQLIVAHGFKADEWDRYVYLQRTLGTLEVGSALPAGFAMRPLAGEAEAEAYAALHRAAFSSDAMTAEWRARTLRAPSYRPDLDLVISAPDGSLAAFCVGWYEPGRGIAQVEPAGVHPTYQRMGLARALLLAMLQRFQAAGAHTALVETDLDRDPARAAYEAAGFRQTHIIRCREQWASQIS